MREFHLYDLHEPRPVRAGTEPIDGPGALVGTVSRTTDTLTAEADALAPPRRPS